jgi:hypothetical protein
MLHQLQTQQAAIQPVPSRLLDATAAVRQLLAAVDDGDVVETEEAALEDVVALAVVLAVHPPGEVHQQLVEAGFSRKSAVRACPGAAGGPSCRCATPPRRARAGSRRRTPTRRRESAPFGMHGTTRSVSSSELASFANVRRRWHRERDAVEREVPGGDTRGIPTCRASTDHVAVRVEVLPVLVADRLAGRWAGGMSDGVAVRAIGLTS